jgi:hypothetical protein
VSGAELQSYRIPKDETGKRYGQLSIVGRDKANRHCWRAKCDCGGFRTADGRELRAHRVKACKTCAKETQGRSNAKWEREAA